MKLLACLIASALVATACGSGSPSAEPEPATTTAVTAAPTTTTVTTTTTTAAFTTTTTVTTTTTTAAFTTTTLLGPPADADIALVASETLADPSGAAGFAFFGEDVTAQAPSITVQPGEEVKVWVLNSHGQYSSTTDSHDFAVVPKLDDIPTLAATGALEDHILWDSAIEKIFGGLAGSVTFVPEAPGEYYFVCTLPGHAAGGMMGEFVVTEG